MTILDEHRLQSMYGKRLRVRNRTGEYFVVGHADYDTLEQRKGVWFKLARIRKDGTPSVMSVPVRDEDIQIA